MSCNCKHIKQFKITIEQTKTFHRIDAHDLVEATKKAGYLYPNQELVVKEIKSYI